MLLNRSRIPSMSALPLHHLRFLESGGLHRPPRRAKAGPGRTSRAVSPLECTLTNNRLVDSLECPVKNSLDLKCPGIRASWPFGGAEVLWRLATVVTPLECTLTKNGLVTPLECTDTNSLDLKSFRFHSYKNPRGGALPFSFYLFPFALFPFPFLPFSFCLLPFPSEVPNVRRAQSR